MHIVGWAIFGFFLLKSIFAILGWYSRDNSDAIYRRKLDVVWDELNRGSFFDFFQRLQQRLVIRVSETFWSPRRKLLRFVGWSLAINVVVLLGAAEAFEILVAERPEHVFVRELQLRPNREYSFGKGILASFFPAWAPFGRVEPIVTNLALLPTGVTFGLLSLLISWKLLQRASDSRRTATVLWHLAINVCVVIMAMLFVNAVHALTYVGVLRWLAPGDYDTGGVSAVEFFLFNSSTFMKILWSLIRGDLPFELTLFEVRGVCFAMSLVLPTLVYLIICGFLLSARLIPERVQRIANHVIFLVSTDKQPVLSQLGTVTGAIAALLGGVVAALKGS
jgi:hypothetical protein